MSFIRPGALSFVVAALALLPIVAVVWIAVSAPATTAMPGELILRYASDTLLLVGAVAVTAAALGTALAWLVAFHGFPGRDFFAWALALPLAAPAYVLAFAWAELLDVAGPVRSWLRETWAIGWFPMEIRSLPGAGLVLASALYPYVYLTVRTTFASLPGSMIESARLLGMTRGRAFIAVALPLARPAIIAGTALALMEAIADYGAVQFLGVQTLTTGVVRAWSSYGALGMAARLSLMLLGAAMILLWIERLMRGQRRFAAAHGRAHASSPTKLDGARAIAASLFCLATLTLSLLLPAGWLMIRAASAVPDLERLLLAGLRSLSLALVGAAVTVFLAAVLAFGGRAHPLVTRLASMGYATPGVVIAVGLLGPATLVWNAVPGAVAGLGAAVALLLYAYAARLMAAALEPIDAGLTRVTPSMERAARTLGESETGTLRRVHLPLVRGSLLTAALLVFVDILKELPATLILRPFDFDTLAILANAYAGDERLAHAAWPSLALLAIAVWPVVILSRKAVPRGARE